MSPLLNENEIDGTFDNSFHTDQPKPINENTAYLSEFPINVEILLLSREHFNWSQSCASNRVSFLYLINDSMAFLS
ncbi:Uncharacterised protein [Acinetobacter baumannii]|nr:Uncharacterised protein [Acinetobacter baumannii]